MSQSLLAPSRTVALAAMLVVTFAAVLACAPELVIGPDARILCTGGEACPRGYACDADAGLCVLAGATLDRAPPFLLDSSVADIDGVIGPIDGTDITLVASEKLASAPVVTRSRGPSAVAADEAVSLTVDPVSDDGITWIAHITSDDADVSGAVDLTADLEDLAGNKSTVPVPVDVTFDVDPPSPVFARADVAADPVTNAIFPGPPRNLRADSGLVIEVAFNELLETASVAVLDAGGAPVGPVIDAGVAAQLARFTFPFDTFLDAADGVVVFEVTATDRHGNTFAGPIEQLLTPALLVDNEPPPPPVVDIVARRPWGSLVPAPVTAGGGTADDALLVLILPGNVALVDGEVPPTVSRVGAFDGTFEFAIPVDVPGLVAISVDDAGNLSAPARPLVARITASIIDTASPHHVIARPVARAALAQRGDRPVDAELRAGTTTIDAAPFWRPLTSIFADAMPRVPALAPDLVSGGVVALSAGRTFLIDGAQVRQLQVPELPLREGVAMSFDSRRGVVVLFGGNGADGNATNSLYEWDGVRWFERLANDPGNTTRPPARLAHTVADVPSLGGVLIVNGCAHLADFALDCTTLPRDVWLWDGAEFTELCTGAACGASPPPLEPAIGVDVDGRVVAIGGHFVGATATDPNEPIVAVFEDGAWTRECGPGCNQDAPSEAAVFERDGELLVYGDVAGAKRLQRYDASGFTDLAMTVRSGSIPSLAFDPPPVTMRADGVIVGAAQAFGGEPQSVFVVVGGKQDGVVPSRLVPRCGGAAVTTSEGAALVGGCTTCNVVDAGPGLQCGGPVFSTQLIDDVAIVDLVTSGPPPSGPAVGALIGGKVVVASPEANDSGDVQITSGAGRAWTQGTTIPGSVLGLAATALVEDPVVAGRGLLFFGDVNGLATFDRIDAVDADGNATTSCASGCGTSALAIDGFAATSARGAFAMFAGGWSAVRAFNDDTAVIDAQPLHAVVTPVQPPRRARAGLAFDEGRGVGWLFGGTTELILRTGNDVFECKPGGPKECDDVWAFDGTAWTELRPVDVFGVGLPQARAGQQTAFDRGLVIAGGRRGSSAVDDAWRLETASVIAPAHMFEAQLDPMGEDAASAPAEVEVLWCGVALDAAGDDVGVDIELWTPAGFSALDVEPVALDPTCRHAVAPPTLRLAFAPRGVDRSMFVQVKPKTSAGATGVGFAHLETTGLEVLVGFTP